MSYLDQDWRHAEALSKEPHLKFLHGSILLALRKMHQLRIPIEVNPTSNEYLQGTCHAQGTIFNPALLYRLLQDGFCGIVCTDNDGIWPTRLSDPNSDEQHNSVAAEVIRVIRGTGDEGSSNPKQLQADAIGTLLDNYQHAAFGSRHLITSPSK